LGGRRVLIRAAINLIDSGGSAIPAELEWEVAKSIMYHEVCIISSAVLRKRLTSKSARSSMGASMSEALPAEDQVQRNGDHALGRCFLRRSPELGPSLQQVASEIAHAQPSLRRLPHIVRPTDALQNSPMVLGKPHFGADNAESVKCKA
jgi:hypothetical protein